MRLVQCFGAAIDFSYRLGGIHSAHEALEIRTDLIHSFIHRSFNGSSAELPER
jgi:hypothetical protein